jgi:hypothetical protein
VGYLTAVFLVLSPVRAMVFMIVQQGLFGLYLGCSFASNHKGMPILAAADRSDFLRRQVLTSRNVRGGWLSAGSSAQSASCRADRGASASHSGSRIRSGSASALWTLCQGLRGVPVRGRIFGSYWATLHSLEIITVNLARQSAVPLWASGLGLRRWMTRTPPGPPPPSAPQLVTDIHC